MLGTPAVINTRSTLAGDFNGDGEQDLLYRTSGGFAVLLSDGTGGWEEVPTTLPGVVYLETGIVADFEGDGLDDIATVPGGFRNEGRGPDGTGPLTFSQVAAEDLGNEPLPESDSSLSCLPNIPGCSDCVEALLLPNSSIERGLTGDFNGDGLIDYAKLLTEREINQIFNGDGSIGCRITERVNRVLVSRNLGQGRFDHHEIPFTMRGTTFMDTGEPGIDIQIAAVTNVDAIRMPDGKDLLGVSGFFQLPTAPDQLLCNEQDWIEYKIREFGDDPNGSVRITGTPGTGARWGDSESVIFGDFNSNGDPEAYYIRDAAECDFGFPTERLVEVSRDGTGGSTRWSRGFDRDKVFWWATSWGMRTLDIDGDGLNEVHDYNIISWGGAHDLRPVPRASRWTFNRLELDGVEYERFMPVADLDRDGSMEFIARIESGETFLILSNADPTDIDEDGTPDRCEPDVNRNGLPDDHEVELGLLDDLNGNGQADITDIALGIEIDGLAVIDGNQNAVPDRVEIASLPFLDANEDALLDGLMPTFELIATLPEQNFWRDVNSNGVVIAQSNGVTLWTEDSGTETITLVDMGLPPDFGVPRDSHILADRSVVFTKQGDDSRDRLYTWHPDRGLTTIDYPSPFFRQDALNREFCEVTESGIATLTDFIIVGFSEVARSVTTIDLLAGVASEAEIADQPSTLFTYNRFARTRHGTTILDFERYSPESEILTTYLVEGIEPDLPLTPPAVARTFPATFASGQLNATGIIPTRVPGSGVQAVFDFDHFTYAWTRISRGRGVVESVTNPGFSDISSAPYFGNISAIVTDRQEVYTRYIGGLVYFPSSQRLQQHADLAELMTQETRKLLYPLDDAYIPISDSGEYLIVRSSNNSSQYHLLRRVFNTNPAPLDLNTDGAVDLADLQFALTSPSDLNGDGNADTDDARALAQWIVWNKPDLAPDCNADGEADLLQLAVFGGPLTDDDADLVPDACQPCSPIDYTEPFGLLDLADIVAFITAFSASDPAADLTEPIGLLDLADVLAFVQAFQTGCS